jgi:subtilisin family serine protease
MRRSSRRLLGAVSGAVVVAALGAVPASAAPSGVGGAAVAPVQQFLAGRLAGLTGSTTVLVHGVDAEAARDGVVSEFSSRGAAGDPSTWPDLSAPGDTITSACRPYLPICATGLDPRNGPGLLDIGTFNTISGTSMAAPHVAGIVAQLFQADPTATPTEIEAALTGTAHRFADGAPYAPVGGRTTSFDKGAGLVDVVAAAQRLTSG